MLLVCRACYCRELYVSCLATWLLAAECYNMLLLTLLWGFVKTSVIITEMIYDGTSITLVLYDYWIIHMLQSATNLISS